MTRPIQFLELKEALHQDERGFVFFPMQGLAETPPQEDICQSLHLISIAPGQVRGQHQHPGKTEWLYIFHGTGRLFWRLPGQERQERLITDNRLLMIIAPGIPHALRNEGEGPLYLLAWRAASEGGDKAEDTVAAPII
ncbi:MAG: cupin domain-containing protein [Desulfobacca sp.]|uniref:cupin domain-containing protein n=1 Tax=Desulfobacca sp. TaxID=2067990 RepID=UPI00404B24DA